MAASPEGIVLDGLHMNDGNPLTILEDPAFQFIQAKKKMGWASSSLSDGSAPVGENRYENAEMIFTVGAKQQTNKDAALAIVHQVTQKLQKSRQVRGGIPLVWAPTGSAAPLTFYAVQAEHDEYPTSRSSGYFSSEPSINCHLYLRPFGVEPEQLLLLGSSEPWLFNSLKNGRWRIDEGVLAEMTVGLHHFVPITATEKRLYLPWTTTDATIMMQVKFGATLGTGNWTAIARRIDANNYLRAGLTGDGWIRLAKTDGGATSNFIQDAYNVLADTYYWIVASFVGDDITLNIYAGDDDGLANPLGGVNHTLDGADAVQFGSGAAGVPVRGNVGFRVNPQGTASQWVMNHWMVRGMPDVRTAEPSLSVEIPDIRGHVDAEARMVIKEESGKARSMIRWGVECDNYDPFVSWPHFLHADSLDVAGMSGTPVDVAGAYDPFGTGTKAILSSELSSTKALVVCGTGNQYHLGTFQTIQRMSGAVGARVRFSTRKGNGPWEAGPWSEPAEDTAWHEVDMGTFTMERSELGLESWEGRIEAMSPDLENGTISINYMFFVPIGSGTGIARAPLQPITAEVFSAVDHFNQGGGPLNNKILGVGGKWLTSGATVDANHPDLTVHADDDPPIHWAERDMALTFSDVSLAAGRYGTVANSDSTARTFTGIQVQCDLRTLDPLPRDVSQENAYRIGIFVRGSGSAGATDGLNWLMAVLQTHSAKDGGTSSGYSHRWIMKIYKRVVGQAGGAPQQLSSFGTGRGPSARLTLLLSVSPLGVWEAYWYPAGTRQPSKPQRSGYDADLTATGPLASGRIGIYDASISTIQRLRIFDNFIAFAPEQDVVMYPNKHMEIRSDRTEREEAGVGTRYGKVPRYQGDRFWLPPSGDGRRVARLFTEARQTDTAGGVTDVGVTDAHLLQVFGSARFLHPSGGV